MLKKLTILASALAVVAVMAVVGDDADARKKKTEGGVYVCHFDKNSVVTGKVQWETALADEFLDDGVAGDLRQLEIDDTKASLRMHLKNHDGRTLRGGTPVPDDYICVDNVNLPNACPDCDADLAVGVGDACPGPGAEASIERNPFVDLGECDAP